LLAFGDTLEPARNPQPSSLPVRCCCRCPAVKNLDKHLQRHGAICGACRHLVRPNCRRPDRVPGLTPRNPVATSRLRLESLFVRESGTLVWISAAGMQRKWNTLGASAFCSLGLSGPATPARLPKLSNHFNPRLRARFGSRLRVRASSSRPPQRTFKNRRRHLATVCS
jgi:hypothetical protein